MYKSNWGDGDFSYDDILSPLLDYCEKFFYQCSNLKTQTKIVHDGKKDYKCEQCGK